MILFMIEFSVAYCLLDYEANKQYTYNFNHQNKISNFTEQTVIGKGKLTVNQKEIYDQLETLINKRKSTDSFNIGLIGDWGSGKTSITDTLIYELEKENKYFFLKISALTFNETGNIIEYVKKFFGDLFKRYEIDYYFGDSNVAFLGSLAMLNSCTKSIKDIVESIRGNSFIDLEKERILFNDQVRRLLEVSKRKNIILIIDDMDRTYHQDSIIKLLSEFSSINGLITIVSLNNDDINHKIINHENKNNEKENSRYREFDKYIHVRIYLDRGNDINYDLAIVNQIYEAYQDKIVDLCCFDLNEENKHFFCFDMLHGYPVKKNENVYKYIKCNNILLELFYENLKLSNFGFGNYFELLINNVVCNTCELHIDSNKELSNERKSAINEISTNLDSKSNKPYFIERWTYRNGEFYSKASQWLKIIIENIDSLKEQNSKTKEKILSIKDLYYCLENHWEGAHIKQSINKIIYIIFNDEELENFNKLLKKLDYDEIKCFCKNKLLTIVESTIAQDKLNDFMTYLANNIINYRSFKIQLREANAFGYDYLSYQIDKWETSSDAIEKYRNKKVCYPELDKTDFGVPKLRWFVNNVLIQNYILKFGTRFNQGELLNSKVFIYHGKNRKIVVISKKNDALENSIYLDITGEILNDLSKEELEEIKKKNEIIWKFK